MDDLPLSRRQFVTGAGTLAAASVFAPQALAARLTGLRAPTLRGGRFAEGVISGDPTPNGITLWSRLAGVGGNGSVELEVAKDRGFRRVVARQLIGTNKSLDHAVKARVGRLDAHEEYFYRFSTKTADSPVGRFRTALPADSRQPVRFAFFSCQDYTFGFFNVQELIAREDIDFVVNLGDYIYAEAYHRKGSQSGGVRTDPVGESKTLDQYRRKYEVYRSTDASLRKMHAKFPMISTWDDHEAQDNYAGGAGPSGGLDPAKGYSKARQAAAYRAFFDSMPTYGKPKSAPRIYRSFRFGRNVELFVVDERQYRADQPCGDAQVGDPCPELNGPRQFLGRAQMSFLKNGLKNSKARWKVIANEVMIMNTIYPGGKYIGFDSWQGYVAERTELLQHIKANSIKDVVFVTGDIHTLIAGDVRIDGKDSEAVATEFVGGSITSQGLGEGGGGIIPGADPHNPKTPESIRQLLFDSNPWVKDADTDHHGYGLVSAKPAGFSCKLRRVDTVKRRSTTRLPDLAFTVRPGHPSLLS
jgi:alkaline phosphatase D